jgi:hypothetical protein
MRHENLEFGGTRGPLATLREIIPFEAAAASDRLGWVGLEAARYRAAPAAELNPPRHDPRPARPFYPAAGKTGPGI